MKHEFKNYRLGMIIIQQKKVDDVEYYLGVSHNEADDATIFRVTSYDGTHIIENHPTKSLKEAQDKYEEILLKAIRFQEYVNKV